MPKILKITGYIVDLNDNCSPEYIKSILNDDYFFSQNLNVEERDIGEWEKDNPLNYDDCPESECEKYFKQLNRME